MVKEAATCFGWEREMHLPSFPNVDLFSAGINALNGALVARNPSHNRGYALVGLLIMAFFGGIGGGVSRDILLNDLPSPLKDSKYIFVCVLMGLLGVAIYQYAESREEQFRRRTLAFFKSFTLPWFAILGAHKSLDHGLGIYSAVIIGMISTTAGGVFIDVCSDVTPAILRPSEHIVTAAVLAATTYVLLAKYALTNFPAFPITLIAVVVAFGFRVLAVEEHWAQIVPYQAPAAGPGARAA
jgi:uncharacterized membrane protein YeiH